MALQRVGFAVCGMSTLMAMVVVASPALPVVAQTTIYNFKGDPDGAVPAAPLIRDNEGNLYGTTETGGINDGSVFKVRSTGEETILHTFTNSPDGAAPWGGGHGLQSDRSGRGSVLHSFSGVPDGAAPYVGWCSIPREIFSE
jgi:uncharacterized repeat protein (TIGR03803 family)